MFLVTAGIPSASAKDHCARTRSFNTTVVNQQDSQSGALGIMMEGEENPSSAQSVRRFGHGPTAVRLPGHPLDQPSAVSATQQVGPRKNACGHSSYAMR